MTLPVPADAISLAQMSKAFFSLCFTDIHMATSRGLALKMNMEIFDIMLIFFLFQRNKNIVFEGLFDSKLEERLC